MGYAATLLAPASFRGVTALSGYIPQKSGLSFDLGRLREFSAFVSHGTYDQTIPVRFGRDSAELLKQAGANVEYREYPMGHEVREETINDLSKWMRKLLL